MTYPDKPAVTFIDISGDDESPIAPTFADYLALLEPPRPDGYVIEGVDGIGAVIAALSKALRITFEPPESWNYGYPVHRACLGSERNPAWIWISPNQVPRGFVRTEDPRYLELKDLLPGTALRFPDLPSDCYLMGATEEVRQRVLKACAESGVVVRPANGAA